MHRIKQIIEAADRRATEIALCLVSVTLIMLSLTVITTDARSAPLRSAPGLVLVEEARASQATPQARQVTGLKAEVKRLRSEVTRLKAERKVLRTRAASLRSAVAGQFTAMAPEALFALMPVFAQVLGSEPYTSRSSTYGLGDPSGYQRVTWEFEWDNLPAF